MRKTVLFICCLFLGGIAGAQCVASFTSSPNPFQGNLLAVSFTSTSTVGTLTPPSQYKRVDMNFGDGTGTYSYFNGGTHTYATPGTYAVGLRISKMDSVTNTVLCTDTTTQIITVAYTACATNITRTYGSAGQVIFTATNPAGTTGMVYTWNYGDGNTGTGSPSTHIYAANGNYTATLTATGGGCTYTGSISVQIVNAPYNCNLLHALFAANITYNSVAFINTSTNNPPLAGSYQWTFGDGATSTLKSPTHVYATTGTYLAKLKVIWVDTVNHINYCQDSTVRTINITSMAPPPLNCSSLNASFSTSVSNNVATFSNSSSTVGTGYVRIFNWNFGDGGTSTAINPSHTYSSLGTYTVSLAVIWRDVNYTTVCMDTAYQTVTISNFPPVIPSLSGYVVYDSSLNLIHDSLKVWLIQFDTTTQVLSAVDSTYIPGYPYVHYSFHNKPAGNYLVKASLVTNVASTNGLIPTYHDSSIYWSGAQPIVYSGGILTYQDVHMRNGVTTAGPGFVAGNVSLGANKGTSGAVPDLLILLRDNNQQVIASTLTDLNGDYHFSNIPLGVYSVYPEQMNYMTTAAGNVMISPFGLMAGEINFNQDDAQGSIKPRNPTTIASASHEASVSLYPNPAQLSVTLFWEDVNMDGATVAITNMTGQQMLHQSINGGMKGSVVLNTATLQSGMYFVHILSAGGNRVEKLVITK